jgi:hypothetical protein
MPADRGTTALVAARFRAGAVLAASITQCWQHCLQRERIRQIEAQALRKLKHPSRSNHLRSFLEN